MGVRWMEYAQFSHGRIEESQKVRSDPRKNLQCHLLLEISGYRLFWRYHP